MADFLPLSLILLLLLSSSAAAHHHHQHHHHHHHHNHHHHLHHSHHTSASSPSPIVLEACNATRFPDVCVTTLSKYPLRPDASGFDIIDAALNASATSLISSQSEVQAILASSASNVSRTTAAHNCIDLLSYSSRRLAAATIRDGGVSYSRPLTYSALLYQNDCWSALKHVNDTPQVGDAMAHLLHLTNLTSNALSLITAFQQSNGSISSWRAPQTERDGYWPPTNASAPFKSSAAPFPSAGDANATVCKASGGCRYETVQAAVDAAPDYGKERYVVYIKAGVYEETVKVRFNKTNVVFIGDGIGRTVITGSLNAGMPGLVSTYSTATVGIRGDGFMARNLTFQNTAGPNAHQAVAFRSDSDFSVFDTVEFAGHQDTLYTHSLRQYYHNCLISGTVDFIFGNAAAVFDNCTILVLPRQQNPEKGESNTITAHGRTDPAQPTGFVLNNCVINGSEEYLALYRNNSKVHKTYLGRPWKEYSRTVVLRSWLSEIVRPEGWLAWNEEFALSTLYYGEFESTGPGAKANTTERVAWSSQVPAEHVLVYSLENFIQGDQFIPAELVGSSGKRHSIISH